MTLSTDLLVHIGAFFFLLAYMARDQLVLRSLIVLGTFFYISFYFVQEQILWPLVAWETSFVLINIFMLAQIYHERAEFKMTRDERILFAELSALNPGEFRRLMKIGQRFDAPYEVPITQVGDSPTYLTFVIEGRARVEKDGDSFEIGPRVFVGELAFLMVKPASATVHLLPGAHCIRWPVKDLSALLRRHPQMKVAFDSVLNQDIARKLAN